MFGYTGKSIKADLSSGKILIFDTPEQLCSDFIGGRGFGVKLISDRITMPYDSADMPLIFATGPLVGTAAPTSGRMSVISRSPLTDTVFDCSVGGRFGTELKRAGYDYIEITGKSSGWVSLVINDTEISIEPSENLAGATTSEAAACFKGMSAAAIGPAGENQVRFASIVFDKHYCAGRGGLGAVMGSKKLKAVAVKGKSSVTVSDATALNAAKKEIMRLLRASQAVFGEFGLSEFGTAALVDLIHSRRMEPTSNFRKTIFDNASSYSGYRMKEHYKTRKQGCSGCPVLCKKIGSNGEVMPEFETVSHFGALNNCSDLEAIVESNRICNEMGLDSITAASTIACYSEIENRNIAPAEMHRLLRQISLRSDNLGDSLAEGSYRYADSKGAPEKSMSVKKLELPAYDPRGAYGMALAYATSNRGGCHLRAYPVSHEILRRPVATDRFSFEGKARIIKIAEDLNAVVDSLTACKFVFFGAGLEEFSRVFNAVTGSDHNAQSLLKAGERIWNLERKLNEMNGFTKSDDDLPERFFTEDGSSNEIIRINALNRDKFLKARENYYRIRGW
ncbi:MAG: aldehyde ferredoxin oxidoreductase family protein [Dissulfurispiraceae bacterium]|jgi:aldehyde:ferredoxin oxidoreductase|nr:aldehyde ferredoxin oxidoreductase family protein [Dissulfurispiraceae bacterium]